MVSEDLSLACDEIDLLLAKQMASLVKFPFDHDRQNGFASNSTPLIIQSGPSRIGLFAAL